VDDCELFWVEDEEPVSRAFCALFMVEELDCACKLASLSAKLAETDAVTTAATAKLNDFANLLVPINAP